MRASEAVALAEAKPPVMRLRYVLIVAILWAAGAAIAPRVRAAWQVHSVASAFADYALCMVGPTGPSLLRDNPPEFWRLARRRLVSALPDDRPFMKCEKSASVVSDSPASRRAHQAAASAFLEWGGDDSPPFKLA